MFRAIAISRAIKRIDGPVYTVFQEATKSLKDRDELSDFEIALIVGWMTLAGLERAAKHKPFRPDEIGRAAEMAVCGSQFHVKEERWNDGLLLHTWAMIEANLPTVGIPGSFGVRFGHWCVTADLESLMGEMHARLEAEEIAQAIQAGISDLMS